MQVKKKQLEPYMEQCTGSILGKEYVKAVYCPPVYLTYMQSTSCEMLAKENEKAGLRSHIQKTKIMAFGPITSWQIDGKTMEAVTDFIFLGSKITSVLTAAMKLRRFLLGRKAVTNLSSILKSRDITLPTKSV